MTMPALAYKSKVKRKKRRPPRQKLNWSEYQLNIFSDINHGYGHTIVLAAPGSGKSATIIEGLYHVPDEYRTGFRTLNVAFNSTTAKYLKDRVPPGSHSKTFHQLGFHTTQRHWGPVYGINSYSVDSDGEIAEELAKEEVGDTEATKRLRKNLVSAMDLAKTKLALEPDAIEDVVAEHGIDTCGIAIELFAANVWSMMQKTLHEPRILHGRSAISFQDMIILPYVYGWQPQQYDRIFVDEAQDLSAARTSLVLSALAPGGRLTAVGDIKQAIYGFAGATPAVIEHLKEELEAKYMPLSVSYRLPRSVVEMAQKINPDIQAAPSAIEGEIHSVNAINLTSMVTPGCAVLSRTNFPLVQGAFQLISNGIRANIQGRDVAKRFLWRIWCWEPETVAQLRTRCNKWCDDVCEILTEKKRPFDRIIDERDSILQFTEGASTVDEVKDLSP
jgi:DNA helicase-2/ATP-dependent DNA helicase PcrA